MMPEILLPARFTFEGGAVEKTQPTNRPEVGPESRPLGKSASGGVGRTDAPLRSREQAYGPNYIETCLYVESEGRVEYWIEHQVSLN